MQTQILVAALLACAAITGASAATTVKAPAQASSQRCSELQAQFDSAKASHTSAKEYSRALTERDAGATQCKAGDYAKGTHALANALKDLGVKPVSAKS